MNEFLKSLYERRIKGTPQPSILETKGELDNVPQRKEKRSDTTNDNYTNGGLKLI